jgi:hypothetical protein
MEIIVRKNISIGDLSRELAEELCETYGSNAAERILHYAAIEAEMIQQKEKVKGGKQYAKKKDRRIN